MKHNIIAFKRIAVQGFHNFFRNAWLTSAATAIMVVTLTIILSSIIVNRALSDTIEDIASNVTVSVYLLEDIKEADRLDLQQTLINNDNVQSVRYISKTDALNIFIEQNRDDPSILSGLEVTDNILPASFEIRVNDLSRLDEVTAVANDEKYSSIVEETSVSQERRKTIDNIAKAQDYIVVASIVTAGIFASISVLVIFNTIRMAVFTRSHEIEIMKLIGATPGYIRAPFLFEACLYGIVAGILSTVAIYSALIGLGPRANKQILIEPTIDLFVANWWMILGGTILVGVLIGLMSSTISLSRYLRLKRW
jgi:cell division transport system permease protein